jgi:hypothetical protein
MNPATSRTRTTASVYLVSRPTPAAKPSNGGGALLAERKEIDEQMRSLHPLGRGGRPRRWRRSSLTSSRTREDA